MAFVPSSYSGRMLGGCGSVPFGGAQVMWDNSKFQEYIFTNINNETQAVQKTPMTYPTEMPTVPSPLHSGKITPEISKDISSNTVETPRSIPLTPTSPTEQTLPRFHQKPVTSTPQPSRAPRTPVEDLTPKQLKRRIQNRVSQQAVRRRRNSPARLLETRLRDINTPHLSPTVMELYTSNIDSCIATLTAEIETLMELKALVEAGNVVPDNLTGMLLRTGNLGVPTLSINTEVAPKEETIGGVTMERNGGTGVNTGNVVSRVDQSAAYQNHDFDSSVLGRSY